MVYGKLRQFILVFYFNFDSLCCSRTVVECFSIKPLNALLLGENYARSLGMNFKKTRLIIIFATSILAGSITAYAGPLPLLD
jgi:ABC-type Fe3+-siderophore transport system permease subunit